MEDTICPACGGQEHYTLKDDRLQCVACRKKYTACPTRCRLSDETLREIVRNFWRMHPASASASERGVNIKTLQKYHDLLRRGISDVNERDALEQLGSLTARTELFRETARRKGLETGVSPLFCLVQKENRVYLLSAQESDRQVPELRLPEPAGWIYARDAQALASLELDRIHWLGAAPGNGRGAEAAGFWIAAKRGLVKYHGGFRKNFHLFMREMEFRFNNHDEDLACGILLGMLRNDVTNRDRR